MVINNFVTCVERPVDNSRRAIQISVTSHVIDLVSNGFELSWRFDRLFANHDTFLIRRENAYNSDMYLDCLA
jgi:hypothetical protein